MSQLQTYTAIDFETAHPKRWSICSLGLVRVENGKVVHKINLLIRPPRNFYAGICARIHGITPKDTLMSPTFDKIWPQIEPYIRNQHVVAHNGFGFDFHCLNQTLEWYGIPVPEYERHCTYKIFGGKLETLCKTYHIPLKNHNPLSDAMACARLFLMYQRGVA